MHALTSKAEYNDELQFTLYFNRITLRIWSDSWVNCFQYMVKIAGKLVIVVS